MHRSAQSEPERTEPAGAYRTHGSARKPTERDEPRGPGPEPERLKIEGDWEEAVRQGLKKKRPPEGWPKPSDEDKTSGPREK